MTILVWAIFLVAAVVFAISVIALLFLWVKAVAEMCSDVKLWWMYRGHK